MLSLVAAMDRKRGIGYRGGLPWPRLKGDMRFFRDLTVSPEPYAVWSRYRLDAGCRERRALSWRDFTRDLPGRPVPLPEAGAPPNAVIMGRRTWQSLPDRSRPLPERLNVVLSRSRAAYPPGAVGAADWEEGLQACAAAPQAFVIGGAQVFDLALGSERCRRAYLTLIDAEFPGDAFLGAFGEDFREIALSPWVEEEGLRYRFGLYERRPD